MKLLKISETTVINVANVRRMSIFRDDSYEGWTYYLRVTYTDGKYDEFDLRTGDNEMLAIRKFNEMMDSIK